MASSSTSSALRSFKYDVFLSFRGEDVRKTFIDHLYAALKQQGFNIFKDDKKLERGERIDDQLVKAIEDSKLFIIVLSQNYASSSWCLDELVKIVECHKNNKQIAYPVFYDVDPSEVRKQRESYGEALAKHNKQEDVEKWRDALKEAGNLAGCDVRKTADGHEAEVIKQIVADISNGLCSSYLGKDGKLVGMEVRMSNLLSNLEIYSDDVRMIGIKGMGGAGKTTLARANFERISSHYDGVSFVDNVRENSKATVSGVQSLQKKILSDLLKDQQITVGSSVEGKRMMENRLCGIKALVVLDDVDDVSQLEALAGSSDWFKPGSRIIITTRDEQVLVAHGVEIMHDINLLSDKEAMCLFSRYAFRGDIPIEGYEELSLQAVKYAAGLPLTVKVLGSHLCGQGKSVWIDLLKRLKKIPLKKTLDILELSYISLEDDHKQIFLDVACLLKCRSKKEAIRMLESCGFDATYGLRVLEQRSLINFSKSRYDDGEYLDMHDHIQEMGRNIVRQDHPDDSSKHSKLWIKEEIKDVLVNDLGNEATRCMCIDEPSYVGAKIIMKGLRSMKKLRVLRVLFGLGEQLFFDHASEAGQHQYFPNALRYLYWVRYPYCSLPKRFQANNLVTLEMPDSEIQQLWEGGERKVLVNLKFLNLSGSKLAKLDLGLTPHLEVLELRECYYLLELDISVGCPNLRSLDLSHSNLTKLDVRLTLKLEMLDLEHCDKLVELDMPTGFLQLRSLSLHLSYFSSLDFGLIPNLEKLSLYLEGSDSSVPHVEVRSRTLDLKQCPNLTECEIEYSKFKTIDLGLSQKLRILNLTVCKDLEELHLPVNCLELEKCEIICAKLKSLDLGLTPNLGYLNLTNCHDLEELHMSVGCLNYLNLFGCEGLKSFVLTKEWESLDISPLDSNHGLPNISLSCLHKQPSSSSAAGNLEKLIYVGFCRCSYLRNILQTIACLPSLTKLTLGCSIPFMPHDNGEIEYIQELIFSCTEIKYFPYIISYYELSRYLKSHKLEHCTSLEELPEYEIGILQRLEKLHLSYTPIKRLPISICKLKHLTSLQLVCCEFLEKLPEDLDELECLEELILQECKLLQHIPNSICAMKCLKWLHLSYCASLEELPEEIGRVKSLIELNIVGTGIRHLPESIFSIKGLHIVGSTWILQMSGYTFTSVKLISKDVTSCYI